MNHSPSTVRDNLSFFSNGAALREPMVAVIDANQSAPPHLQILAAATAVMVMCEGIGYDPHQVLAQLERAKADVDTPFARQWAAMAEYAKGEFL